MTFKMNILASDEAQYLDADSVKTERTYLSKDGKSTALWKIGTKYYVEINTYFDETFGGAKIMPLTEVSISLR